MGDMIYVLMLASVVLVLGIVGLGGQWLQDRHRKRGKK